MVDSGSTRSSQSVIAQRSLETGIGMAYVRAEKAEPGTELEIDVDGERRAARVEERPLYTPRSG